MKLARFLLTSAWVLFAACTGGQDIPEAVDTGSSTARLTPFNMSVFPVRVSLLGDSITSYEGYLPAYFDANGAAYYPTGTVTSVTQQYWYKLIYLP